MQYEDRLYELRDTLRNQAFIRAWYRFNPIATTIGKMVKELDLGCCIAGGVLVPGPNSDIDIYVYKNGGLLTKKVLAKYSFKEIHVSRWARTTVHPAVSVPVQFISTEGDPMSIIEGFDFGCCQVAASVMNTGYLGAVYITDHFLFSMATRRPLYVGGKYPLRSLVRLYKYLRRGFDGIGWKNDLTKIVKDLVEKGISDPRTITESGISEPDFEGELLRGSAETPLKLKDLFEELHKARVHQLLSGTTSGD